MESTLCWYHLIVVLVGSGRVRRREYDDEYVFCAMKLTIITLLNDIIIFESLDHLNNFHLIQPRVPLDTVLFTRLDQLGLSHPSQHPLSIPLFDFVRGYRFFLLQHLFRGFDFSFDLRANATFLNVRG